MADAGPSTRRWPITYQLLLRTGDGQAVHLGDLTVDVEVTMDAGARVAVTTDVPALGFEIADALETAAARMRELALAHRDGPGA